MADLAVTGSTRALGGRVARALADLGIAQRLIVRDGGRAPRLDRAEIRQVPGGDADPAGYREALEGVGTLFLAADSTFLLGRDHWATEEAIRETGVASTFLRDSFYLDFIPYFAGPERTFRGPAGDGRLLPSGAPDWMIDGRVSTYTAIADGSLDQLSGDVEAVTGRPPQTLDAHPELLSGAPSG